ARRARATVSASAASCVAAALCAVITIPARSPEAGDTATSTDLAGAQPRPVTSAARTSGCAIGQSPTSTTSCERCASSPAVPPGPTENLTLVRQPRPPQPPPTAATAPP